MSEKDDSDMKMESRGSKFGPSDVPELPKFDKKRFSGVVEASAGGGAGGGSEDWEKFVEAAKKLQPGKARMGLYEQARNKLTDELSRAALSGDDQRIAGLADKLDEVYGLMSGLTETNVSEIQRQYEDLMSPMKYGNDVKGRQNAANRWLVRHGNTAGVDQTMVSDIKAILNEDPGKALEIEPSVDMKLEIRMAMIKDLGVSTSGDPMQKCDQFVRQQVSRFGGMGKTHFSADYEKDLRTEYLARAELAAVVGFWDDLASVMSKGTDVWKEMTESRIDRCVKLSKSTYEWLADGKKRMGYKSEVGLERSNGMEVEQRVEMNKVSSAIYTKMIAGDLDVWNTRGEDRWSMIGQIARELNVSTDSVRLSWQLAEAECWQARMGVSFISHPAVRVVIPSKYRNFRSRKVPDSPVPGGSRLWSEYLRSPDHKNQYPTDDSTYDVEGRRLARVGFEAWTIRVTKEKDEKDQFKDSRYGKYRDGVVFLFSDKVKLPKSLKNSLVDDLLTVDKSKGLVLKPDEGLVASNLVNVLRNTKDDKRGEINGLAENAIGGERALWAGQYFSQLEVLLKQPGFLDVDLPQTVTMTDLSKAAGVFDAIEAFGKIDATKASTEELTKLRNALTSQHFRFQSNDLDTRGGSKRRKIVMMEDTPNEKMVDWEIGVGVQERMSKARIFTGQLMEEWSKSYVWLLSWDNQTNQEGRIVGFRDWVLLARDVVRDWDAQRQWGQFVGYGYGNYDKNELAVDENGNSRSGATNASKQAARQYIKWFNTTMYPVNRSHVAKADVRMSEERRTSDIKGFGTIGPLFWNGGWW